MKCRVPDRESFSTSDVWFLVVLDVIFLILICLALLSGFAKSNGVPSLAPKEPSNTTSIVDGTVATEDRKSD